MYHKSTPFSYFYVVDSGTPNPIPENGLITLYGVFLPHCPMGNSISLAKQVQGDPPAFAESSIILNFMLIPPAVGGTQVKYLAGTPALDGMVSVAVAPWSVMSFSVTFVVDW
jgi:hypothetical protein